MKVRHPSVSRARPAAHKATGARDALATLTTTFRRAAVAVVLAVILVLASAPAAEAQEQSLVRPSFPLTKNMFLFGDTRDRSFSIHLRSFLQVRST